MLLLSAVLLALCIGIVISIVRREKRAGASDASKTGEEESVSSAEALKLLRSSRHLQIISLVIAFAAIGAAIIEQQLNMATAEAKGATNTDAITAFLAQITVYLSLIGFVIQVVPHQPHPPLSRHRLRAADSAGQPRQHRRADAR